MEVTPLIFYVNGKRIVEFKADPAWTLAYYLREKLCLCGTKLGCQVGGCGSCTVVIGKWDGTLQRPRYFSANSCIVPLYFVHGKAVTTVEGLGSVKMGMHAVQERLSMGHGSQCGFCTPGFVMSMFALLRNNPKPTKEDIEMNLRGNLCRCTGYRPILQSFHTFGNGCGKENCCQNNEGGGDTKVCLTDWTATKEYDPSQDPIFPSELQKWSTNFCDSLYLEGTKSSVYCPSSLKNLFEYMEKNIFMHTDARIIASGHYLVQSTLKSESTGPWVSIAQIQELKEIEIGAKYVRLGSGLSIQEMENALVLESEKEKSKHGVLSGLLSMLKQYSSPQTKNTASWCGNLMSTGFVSDLKTCLLASHTTLIVCSANGQELRLPFTEKLFNDEGIPALPEGYLISGIEIPKSEDQHEYFMTMKQGTRHGPDSSIVNLAVYFHLDPNGTVLKARIAMGGLVKRPVFISVAGYMVGKALCQSLLDETCTLVAEDLNKLCPGQSDNDKYRRLLGLSMFYQSVQSVILGEGGTGFYAQSMTAEQTFAEISGDQPCTDPLGRPVQTQSGQMHTTGEATYTDDIKVFGMCHGALVQSRRAKANIKSVDISAAMQVPNVIGYVDKADIPQGGVNNPGYNMTTLNGPDELAFADTMVTSMGQVIGAVIAEDPITARFAANLVKVVYEDLQPDITFDQAEEHECYLDKPVVHKLGDGSIDDALKECEMTLTGVVEVGGQEHFYMENHCAVVVPMENEEIMVQCSTQYPSAVQTDVSRLIDVANHKVVVKLRRIGGGFGGKAQNHGIVVFPAALAALKFGRPVKISLTRYEDIIITGKRHPAKSKFEVGFTKDGILKALKVNAVMDCGHTFDISPWIAGLFTMRFDHTYSIPSMLVETKMIRTNVASNTAFRGFGCPQAFFMMESIIDRVAHHLKLPPEEVRRKNFALTGWDMLNGDKITESNDYLLRCWEECIDASEYQRRRIAVDQFNQHNTNKKRGLAIIPTRFGIGMAGFFFEQGQALVNIYRDGSVLISHGGVEIGQGLNTKVMQVASRVLQIPLHRITITDHSSDKVPNAAQTTASQGTDVFGLAVKNGCEELMERLKPVMQQKPNASWEEWIVIAYNKRINLSVAAHGKPYFECKPMKSRYYVGGAACTEVEVDCLTGDHSILQSDIVIDIGESLNPAVDIGQIEGGFVQGYGYYTSEEVVYDESGRLLTNSALSYKIPNALSVPRKFNTILLKGSPERHNLFSSKGIGEPSLFLGSSVYFAISDAVNSHRAQHAVQPVFMHSPATPAKIRLACRDKFVDMLE